MPKEEIDQAEKVENKPNLRNLLKKHVRLILIEFIFPLFSYNIIFLGYVFYLLVSWWHGGACEIVYGTHRIRCPLYPSH